MAGKTKEIDDWDKQINEAVDRRIAALTAPNKARRENLRDALNAATAAATSDTQQPDRS